jgi:hypothetical protein
MFIDLNVNICIGTEGRSGRERAFYRDAKNQRTGTKYTYIHPGGVNIYIYI